MVDQATLKDATASTANGAGAPRSRFGSTGPDSDRSPGADAPDPNTSGVVTNVASLGENLLTLAELQARLTAVELRQNLESLQTGGALIVASSILAVASLPVLMVGVAELLVSELGMKRGYALLTAGSVAIAIAGLCIGIALSWLRKKPLGFPVASEEFARNLSWVRTILRHSGRWPLHR
jgi:hypothetical protein